MATATIRPLPVDQAFGPDETNGSPRSQERTQARLLALVVGVALAIRLIVVAFIFRGLSDPADHFQSFGEEVGWIARSIALHQGFSSPFFPTTGPTALLPPLYPYLLAAVFKVFGIYSTGSALVILVLNSLFSALTCIPIYLATRISVNARAARYAGWAWAIYPFAIYFSAARVWEYSLTSLILTTCFWLALTLDRNSHPARWLGVGLLFGLAGLSNPAVLSLFPVLLLLPLWRFYRATRRVSRSGQFRASLVRNALSTALGVLAVLTPWTVRNYRVMHVLCPVRDCFWYEFWSANNGDGSNPTLGWTHPASNPVELQLYQTQGEIPYIAQKRTMVREFVAHHHAFFAGITLRRIFYYWTGYWSFDPSYVRQEPTQIPNIFFCSSLTLVMIFGAVSWGRREPSAAMPYLLSIAIFPVAYYISHPLMDYRQPIEPAIVVLVVVGLRALKAAVVSQFEIVRAMSGIEVSGMEIPIGHSFLPGEQAYAEIAVAAPVGEPTATAG
jgi:4-amino-4-deoxy-L-arabinose transferase-like glycosyltransferase